MSIYLIITILISLSAAFAYINHRLLRLPFVIGLFLISTVLSIFVLTTKSWLPIPLDAIRMKIEALEMNKIIIDYLLGFLLFAGALHTDFGKIRDNIRAISLFAFVGVILSTIIIASLLYFISGWLGISIDYIYCLLFGALISPTDPIAVLGILTKAKVPKRIETTIVGESLFNDGVGVVVFLSLLQTLNTGSFDFTSFGLLFLQEAVGGLLFGLVFGFILHFLLKSIDHYETELLLTIAFVMGGYHAFNYLHFSGALAMVVMGLMVGNYKQNVAMSDVTQEYINKFWELVDVVLNAILFIIIAFVIMLIDINVRYILLGIIGLLIVILARTIVVYIPIITVSKFLKINKRDGKIIVWGGLRGGLSLALVLSLPPSNAKNILLILTYCTVLFSIVIQGLTIEHVAKLGKSQK